MTYYTDGFIMPAKDADVVAWYRDKPAPFPDIPHRPASGYCGRSEWHYFCEEEREQVMDRKRLKKHVLEALKLNSGLRGPSGVNNREEWLKACSLKRKMIAHALKEQGADPFEVAESIKKYKAEHRRTIAILRSTRCGEAPQWTAGVCARPYYVEPNCHHVPHDEIQTAEANGVAFHRVYLTIDSQLFFRLQNRFRKSGRIKGLWTDKYDVDDDFSHDNKQPVRCMFAFSDPAEAEKLEEEMVWIKMRF